MDLMATLKTYWSILQTLSNNEKIRYIPILLQNNKYVTDFEKKAELFNLLYAKQCSIIENSSELPLNFLKKQTSLSLQLLSLVMICNIN